MFVNGLRRFKLNLFCKADVFKFAAKVKPRLLHGDLYFGFGHNAVVAGVSREGDANNFIFSNISCTHSSRTGLIAAIELFIANLLIGW